LNDFERFKVMKLRKQVGAPSADALLPLQCPQGIDMRNALWRTTMTNPLAGPLRGPEDLCQDPCQREGINGQNDVGRHGVTVVAACRCWRTHSVQFLSHPEALYGFQEFKTWIRVNYSDDWHGAIRTGRLKHGSCMHPHVANESNPQVHEPQNATRIANLIPPLK
jgi:hypothetical protein